MPRPRSVSHDILHAALAGLEAQKQRIEHQITQVHTIVHGIGVGLRTMAQGAAPMAEGGGGRKPGRRKMSAQGRKRIAAAQKNGGQPFAKPPRSRNQDRLHFAAMDLGLRADLEHRRDGRL
jgi:hypothetical protein